MNWEDYVVWADSTALYPHAGSGNPIEMMYIALGLQGEIAEYLEKMKGASVLFGTPNSNQAELIKELGDCFWYLARAERVKPEGLSEKTGANDTAKILKLQTAISGYGLSMASLYLGNETKKLLRDGISPYRLSRVYTIYNRLWESLIREVEFRSTQGIIAGLSEVLDLNKSNLESRKSRDTLHGEGNNR